jgi:hypothetical protein
MIKFGTVLIDQQLKIGTVSIIESGKIDGNVSIDGFRIKKSAVLFNDSPKDDDGYGSVLYQLAVL